MTFALYSFDFLSAGLLHLIPRFPYYIIDALIIIAPSCGYIDLCRIMFKSKSSLAYNGPMTVTLIFAQALKILFFIISPFSYLFFCQTLLLFLIAFLMTFTKFYYEEPVSNFPYLSNNFVKRNFRCPDPTNFSGRFLKILQTRTFLEFVLSFSIYSLIFLLFFLIFYFIVSRKVATDLVFILAHFIELFVSIPFFIIVVIRRTDQRNNISPILIFQFVLIDIVKIAILVYNNVSAIVIGGCLCQFVVDLILICFYFLNLGVKRPNSNNASENVNLISARNNELEKIELESSEEESKD